MKQEKIPPNTARCRLSLLTLALRNFDENLFVQTTDKGLIFVDEYDNFKGYMSFETDKAKSTWLLRAEEEEKEP